MDPIFDAKGDLITSGLHPGKGNSQIPLWEKGTNVVFKDGSVKPAPFQSLIFNKSSGLLGNGIRSIDNNGSPALVWGNRRRLYRGTSVPTSNDATRAATLINALDNDASNWTGVNTTVSDEGTIVAPWNSSTDSLKFAGVSGEYVRAWRALTSTDFTGKLLNFWIYINSGMAAELSANPGDALRVRLSSENDMSDNWEEYWLPLSLFPTHSTWYQIDLDLSVEAADADAGTLDITAVQSIQLELYTPGGSMSPTDLAYFDEMEFSGVYSGTDLDRWSIVQFGQSVLATNGVDEVQYLADITTGVFQDISDAGADLATTFRTKILHKLGPFVIAFNTDNDDTEARWCSEDNLLNWLPVATNSARDINLRDMNSSIKAVIEFGNALLAIGESRAHIFQFIGSPLYFGAQKHIDGIGAVGKNAVTEGGRLIYGFSAHGIYVTDGITKQYIDEPDVHSFIYEGDNKYDATRAELVCVWEDTNDDEIYFSYPTIDGSGYTVSFSPNLQIWSMHDYWRTTASPGEHWKAPVLLSDTGDIWIQSEAGTGTSADVNPLGLSDEVVALTGYGHGGYGQSGYGGHMELD